MTDITKSDIDEQTGVVNTILLWRIYDTMLMVFAQLGGDAGALGQLHEAGQFIGPNPSVSLEEEDEGPINLDADQPEPGK